MRKFLVWGTAVILVVGCSTKDEHAESNQRADSSAAVAADTIGTGPWRWIATVTSTARIRCDNPDVYTITFLPDSTVRLLIDCNRGSGPYQMSEHEIHIGPLAATRMMCPPGSMDAAFAANLNSVQRWSHNVDTLQLEMTTGGSMLLVR